MMNLSSINPMAKYEWNLRGYLESKDLIAARVVDEIGKASRAPTVYRLSGPDSNSLAKLDMKTLNDLIEALSNLTGEKVTPNSTLR